MFVIARRSYCVLFVTLVVTSSSAAPAGVIQDEHHKNVDLRMPDVQPQVADTYLCHSMKLDKKSAYLTGFIPHASMDTAHHMLLYGCTTPGGSSEVWDCGEMHSNSDQYESGQICASGTNIVYAWAMDAPDLSLPQGVGFKVGGDTDIQWLVLQVHYRDVSNFLPPKNNKDNSGITLVTTDIPQPKRAGVFLLGTGGTIPPHSTTYMEAACSYNDKFQVYPFAYRTHAHTHGEVVSGYRIRDGEWTEIGRKSPKLPEMFYNVTHSGMSIKPGDILAARCTMVNNENRTVRVGSTSNDEMCNFYMMYYVDGGQLISDQTCFTDGPPHWFWADFDGLHPENAPLNASVVPGTDYLLEATNQFINKVQSSLEREQAELQDEVRELMESTFGQRQHVNPAGFDEDRMRVGEFQDMTNDNTEDENVEQMLQDMQQNDMTDSAFGIGGY